MRVTFRIDANLLDRVRVDLKRPHAFAAERVGFLSCRVAGLEPSGWIVLAHDFHPVADGDYLQDHSVAAMMGPAALRKALQFAFHHEVGMFHIHLHDHRGNPWFSRTDLRENAKFVPDFFHVRPHLVHGAIVLSRGSLAGMCWHPQSQKPIRFSDFSIVGAPMCLSGRSG